MLFVVFKLTFVNISLAIVQDSLTVKLTIFKFTLVLFLVQIERSFPVLLVIQKLAIINQSPIGAK
jgi:hypothetical protein